MCPRHSKGPGPWRQGAERLTAREHETRRKPPGGFRSQGCRWVRRGGGREQLSRAQPRVRLGRPPHGPAPHVPPAGGSLACGWGAPSPVPGT